VDLESQVELGGWRGLNDFSGWDTDVQNFRKILAGDKSFKFDKDGKFVDTVFPAD